jgi:hypothetical protein
VEEFAEEYYELLGGKIKLVDPDELYALKTKPCQFLGLDGNVRFTMIVLQFVEISRILINHAE